MTKSEPDAPVDTSIDLAGTHLVRNPDDRAFTVAILAVTALGSVLRAVRLDIPMRYDEAVTYLSYASKGWHYVAANYQNPNNHVFHTLLVSWLTGLLGDAPAVIRMPAFLAGCALVPVTAWVGRLARGREAGFLAATLVATSPVLIEFSTNARGYSLMSLCVLLAIGLGLSILSRRRQGAWVGLVGVAVIGLYTIPTMAIAWLGITLWLAAGLYAGRPRHGSRLRSLGVLVGVNVLVGALVAVLYADIVLHSGLDALVGNKYVSAEPARAFLAAMPGAIAGIARDWSRGVPRLLSVLGAAAVLAGIWLDRGGRRWLSLIGCLAASAMAAVAVMRNWGEPRIWMWLLPVVEITAAIGVVEVLERRAPHLRPTLVVGVGSVWAAAMIVQIQLTHPVRTSQETGGFPEGPAVFAHIIDRYRRGDAMIGDFVDVEPLEFYLDRWSETHEPPPRASLRRVWVVLNHEAPRRARLVRDLLRRMGAPSPEESRPVVTVGPVSVYLLGQPAGTPDVRLLQAIDWDTGVAGHIDDERALALMEEVADQVGSPLAKAWIARCRRIGCLGLEVDASAPARAPSRIMDDIRQMAAVGETEAEFLLGTSYAEGWGGPKDAAAAVRWYRSAAEAGHVLASRLLGTAYSAGRGVEPSDSAALVWWRKAAEAGDAIAELKLALAYADGRGATADPAEARAWYVQARDRGAPGAAGVLRELRPR